MSTFNSNDSAPVLHWRCSSVQSVLWLRAPVQAVLRLRAPVARRSSAASSDSGLRVQHPDNGELYAAGGRGRRRGRDLGQPYRRPRPRRRHGGARQQHHRPTRPGSADGVRPRRPVLRPTPSRGWQQLCQTRRGVRRRRPVGHDGAVQARGHQRPRRASRWSRAGFGGFTVQVAVMVRVSNGRITEWLDAPINRIGGLVNSTEGGAHAAARRGQRCGCLQEVSSRWAGTGTRAAQAGGAGSDLWHGEAGTVLECGRDTGGTGRPRLVRGPASGRPAAPRRLRGPECGLPRQRRRRPNSSKGRAALLRAVCGTFGGQQRLTELYPIGSDFDTLVLTESVNSQGTRTASLFRVQKNLITEWHGRGGRSGRSRRGGEPEFGGLPGGEHRARTAGRRSRWSTARELSPLAFFTWA